MLWKKERNLEGAGGKKKKKGSKRVTLHHTTGKFCQANSQSDLMWLYSQQTCSNAIIVSLHCL